MQEKFKDKAVLVIFSIFFLVLINSSFTTNNLLTFNSDHLLIPSSLSNDYAFNWYRDWGSSYLDYGLDAVVDSDDFIYVCGNSDTTGSGDYDMVLIKYSNSGVEQWSRTWGGSGTDEANSLAFDDSNNIYIVGYTTNAGDSNGDLCIVKYDNSGNYLLNIT